jgi:outer membrane translocation and assembly module TamA
MSACNPTRRIADNEYLLEQSKVLCDNESILQKNLTACLEQKTNKRILGVRFHLWLSNLSNPGKNNRINRYLRNIGEEPILFDSTKSEKTKQQLLIYLHNKGYYHAEVTDSVVLKNKRAYTFFTIVTNVPYTFNDITYQFEGNNVSSYVLADTVNSFIKKDRLFDIDVLMSERLRIEANLKEKGFFNFTKEYIYYEADTALNAHKANLKVIVKNYNASSNPDSSVFIDHKQYKINNVEIMMTSGRKQSLADVFDTVAYNNLKFIYKSKPFVNTSTVSNSIYLYPNELFKQSNVDETYRHLTSLKVFKFVNVNFNEISTLPTDTGLLDCRIQLLPMVKQNYQVEAEGTNSSGNYGAALSLSYQHKNIFGGAEIFDLKLRGAYETTKQTTESIFRNTLELGAESNILIPKFLLPFKNSSFVKKFNPKTNINIGYNYQRRPNYWKTIANVNFGYTWSGNSYTSFAFNPLELSYVKLPYITPSYKIFIDTSYLRYSFYDHFLSVTSFSFTFNNQNVHKNTRYVYFKFNVETSGNTLWLMTKLNGGDSISSQRQIFGNVFYQYVKSDVDFRVTQPLNRTDRIVYRIFAGAGLPYWNTKNLPFEKMYFSGGPSRIRAWSAMRLGPGSYMSDNSKYGDRFADLKLESNIEYRFKLFWVLEGALFADAGNIWDITLKEEREAALFKLNRFYKEIAVGTGFGLRFDFNFFIARFDLGLKLRDPQYPSGERWTIGSKPLSWSDDFNMVFGIGYPF